MPKTKNADAFRDFKSDKFFQRRLFKKFNFPNKSDDEILEMLTPTDKIQKKKIKEKLYLILELKELTNWYIERLEKHTKRLVKFKRTFKQIINVDEEGEELGVVGRSKTEIYKANELIGTVALIRGYAETMKTLLDKIFQDSLKLLYESSRLTLARNLKKMRKSKKLSMADVAAFCGLSTGSYAQYELENPKTAKTPPLEKLIALCTILDTDLNELTDW